MRLFACLALIFSTQCLAAPIQLQPLSIDQLHSLLKTSAKPTLVNLWATWCDPCKKEFPIFTELQRKNKNIRVLLVSMDFDSQKPEVLKFLRQQNVDFVTYIKTGSEEVFINGFAKEWQGALPASALFDSKGNIKKIWNGEVSKDRLLAELK